jgi:hypothetical protein
MAPFSTALRHLSHLWGSLAKNFRKDKAVGDMPPSPGPFPLPHKNLEEPQHAANFFYVDDQARPFPSSSLLISDPSSSFGLPWLSLTSPRHGPPEETEEIPSDVSYEEILVTGQKRIAAYEEWCRVTNVSMV